MVQPASRRLLTEAVAAATYATLSGLSAAVTAAVPAATANLPRGHVATFKNAATPTVTLTAGRMYRVDGAWAQTFNANVQTQGWVTLRAGTTAPAPGATIGTNVSPIAYGPAQSTGSSITLTLVGTFTVPTSGSYTLGAMGYNASGSTVTAFMSSATLIVTDIGASSGQTPFTALT